MRPGPAFPIALVVLLAGAARGAEAGAEEPKPLDAIERRRVHEFVHRAPILVLGRAASVRPIEDGVAGGGATDEAEWFAVRVEVEAFVKGVPVGAEAGDEARAPNRIEFLALPVSIIRGNRLVSALDRETLLPAGARGYFALSDRREHPKLAEAGGAAGRIRYAPAPRETYAPCLLCSAPIDAAVKEWLAREAAFARPKLAGAEDARVRALVRELGSEDFETREAAQAKLAAFGWRAHRLVRELGERHEDREVRRRAADLLERYADEMTPAAVAAAEEAKPALAPVPAPPEDAPSAP